MADTPLLVKYAPKVIRVRLFAGLREQAGWSRRELDGIGRVSEVWPALELGEEPPGLLYAVNREYADKERNLAAADWGGQRPPVAAQSFRLSVDPLSLGAVAAEVAAERA